MKKANFKTILVGLLFALGSFYLIIFIHTLLDLVTQIRLKKPLNAYLLWGYSPMIVSGIYIGFSGVKKTPLIGASVGVLFYFFSWLVIDILIPAPYSDHSFKPLSFGFGLLRNGFLCSLIAWLIYTVSKKGKREVNYEIHHLITKQSTRRRIAFVGFSQVVACAGYFYRYGERMK
jgi:hypothetical protein